LNISLALTNVKALQAFQLMRQGSIILTGILLAKSTIGVTAIGQYEILFFIGTTLSIFWVNSMLQGLLAMYPKLDFTQQRDLVFNSYITILGTGILMFLFFLLGKDWLLPMLTGQEDVPYFWLYFLFFTINLPTYLVEYIYLLDNRPKHIFGYGIFSFGLQFAAIVVPIFLGYSFKESFTLLVVLGVLKHIWTLRLVFRKGWPKFDSSLLAPYWKLVIPLIGVAVMGGFTLFFDNWLVGYVFKSEDTFAIFRFGARELPLVTALSMAFGAAVIPEISKSEVFALEQIKKKSAYLMHLLFPISLLLLLTSHRWFPWVFSAEFADSVQIFNVYLLLVISRLIFPNSILVGKKMTNHQFWATFIGLVFNIVLSVWWVFVFGIVGIAYATIVAFFIEKMIMVIALQMKGVKLSSYIPWATWVSYSVVLITGWWWFG